MLAIEDTIKKERADIDIYIDIYRRITNDSSQ